MDAVDKLMGESGRDGWSKGGGGVKEKRGGEVGEGGGQVVRTR